METHTLAVCHLSPSTLLHNTLCSTAQYHRQQPRTPANSSDDSDDSDVTLKSFPTR
jgi:hypothetical protein